MKTSPALLREQQRRGEMRPLTLTRQRHYLNVTSLTPEHLCFLGRICSDASSQFRSIPVTAVSHCVGTSKDNKTPCYSQQFCSWDAVCLRSHVSPRFICYSCQNHTIRNRKREREREGKAKQQIAERGIQLWNVFNIAFEDIETGFVNDAAESYSISSGFTGISWENERSKIGEMVMWVFLLKDKVMRFMCRWGCSRFLSCF